METEKEEEHTIHVLSEVHQQLREKNAIKLRELSDHTIHAASTIQDPGSITLAVLVYTLSKLIERGDNQKLPQWNRIERDISLIITQAINDIKNKRPYDKKLIKARELLEMLSPNFKSYIQDVLRKAAINKGSKIYEHGISLEQTAKLLGLTLWELSEYVGQRNIGENIQNLTMNTKKRAQTAQEFFS